MWIGDIDGFQLYQKEYHSISEDIDVKKRMRTAFESVIENSDLESIGDYHISTKLNYEINPGHPVFIHDLKVQIDITEPQVINIQEKGRFEALPLGTKQGGSHGLSYLTTASPDFHGVAIHYTHGDFGLLFCPQLSFNGILFKDINGRDFVDKVKAVYDIPLRGFIKMDDSAMQYIDNRVFGDV